MPARVRIEWDHGKVAAIVDGMPRAAHAEAAGMAARAAAARIGGGGTGALARDVAVPKGTAQNRAPAGTSAGGQFASGFHSIIGSDLPYARIEHFGGEIHARNPDKFGRLLLYIRPGDIQAAVPSVFHHGKRYLDAATTVYVNAMTPLLKANFPG